MADKTAVLALKITGDGQDGAKALNDNAKAADKLVAATKDASSGVDKLSASMGKLDSSSSSSGLSSTSSRLSDIDRSATDAADGYDKMAEASDTSESRAQGFADTLTGLNDTMLGAGSIAKGPSLEGFVLLGTGLADLAGGVTEFVAPALKFLRLSNLKAAASTVVHKAATIATTAATKAWAVAQGALNLVMAANPIVLVTLAIVALVAIIVVAYKKSETFRKIVDGAFSAVKRVVVGTVKAVVGFVRENWKKILLLLTGPFGLAVLGIRKYGGRIKDFVVGLANRVIDFVRNHWKQGLLLLLTGPFGLAIIAIRSKFGAIKSFISGVVSDVVGFFRSRWRDIAGLAGDAVNAARERAVAAAGRLRDGVVNVATRVVSFFQGLPSKITRAVGNLGHLLWDAGADIINGLLDGITSKIDDLKSKLSGVTDLIPDWKGPRDRDRHLLEPAGRAIMDGLVAGIDSRKGKLHSKLTQLTRDIRRGVHAATAHPIELHASGSAGKGPLRPQQVVNVTVNGAVDPMSTARQIRDLLRRQDAWRGQVVTA